MTKVDLRLGDCLDVLAELADASIDSIVTDPPYGIGFMGKKWDDAGALANREPSDARRAEGQKFQRWCETWATEALRVLKPGGHALVFGGTRTYHRLASGLEDAGFEVRDCIAWLYGSGFPKSMNVALAIDKVAADPESDTTGWVRQEHPGRKGTRTTRDTPGARIGQTMHATDENPDGLRHVYVPQTDEAVRNEFGVGIAIGGYRPWENLSDPQREAVLDRVRLVCEAYVAALTAPPELSR